MTELKRTLVEVAPASEDQVISQLEDIWWRVKNDPTTRDFAKAQRVDVDELDQLSTLPFGAIAAGERNGIGSVVLVGVTLTVASEFLADAIDQLWLRIVRPTLEARYPTIRYPVRENQ